jgi:type IV secretory pathway VirB10-like protein
MNEKTDSRYEETQDINDAYAGDENANARHMIKYALIAIGVLIGIIGLSKVFCDDTKTASDQETSAEFDMSTQPDATQEGQQEQQRLREMHMELARYRQQQQEQINAIMEEIESLRQQRQQTMSASPQSYHLPYHLRKRTSNPHQQAVSHLQNVSFYTMDEGAYANLLDDQGDALASIEDDDKSLYRGAAFEQMPFPHVLPAGSRLSCVTTQKVNSDFPGIFTAEVMRPRPVKGMTLLLESTGQTRNRMPIHVRTLVRNDGSELRLAGQVQMDIPGMTGTIKRHWPRRIIPNVASAALGGGVAYWLLSTEENDTGLNVSSREQIAEPIIQEGTHQVQNEIERFGKDWPNTVIIPHGTHFEVLLTKQLRVE